MEQKKFMDIDRLVENEYELAPGITKKRNCDSFKFGLPIQITEKIDGSNASIHYDKDTDTFDVFSRNLQLSKDNGLNGFYDYIMTNIDKEKFKNDSDYVIFGEWLTKHNCKYDDNNYKKWYVYDIWSILEERYLYQNKVKEFCRTHDLIYVHELYYGPFISWDHCRSFCNLNTYGPQQEGVVVKKMTNEGNVLNNPPVLKIVNEQFCEIKHTKKELRPEQIEFRKKQQEIVNILKDIVTKNRIIKIIQKLCDENVLPKELGQKDIGLCLKVVPKLALDDCLKEEPEIKEYLEEKVGRKAFNTVIVETVKEILV